MSDVVVRALTPTLWIAERPLEEGMNVCALVAFGEDASAVVDTLTSPEDMEPIIALLREHGRPTLVVNTHGDWDHVWGNSAFGDAPIFAHRLCRAAMLTNGPRTLARKRTEEPGRFDGVIITPPTVTFAEFMEIDLGGMTLAMYHLPGHTGDELVVHLPELGVLFTGDAAEWPIPTTQEGPLGPWAEALRQWAARDDVETVIPSHGPISDPQLLDENADYLDALLDDPDLRWDPPPDAADYYLEAHRQNADLARRERQQTWSK